MITVFHRDVGFVPDIRVTKSCELFLETFKRVILQTTDIQVPHERDKPRDVS